MVSAGRPPACQLKSLPAKCTITGDRREGGAQRSGRSTSPKVSLGDIGNSKRSAFQHGDEDFERSGWMENACSGGVAAKNSPGGRNDELMSGDRRKRSDQHGGKASATRPARPARWTALGGAGAGVIRQDTVSSEPTSMPSRVSSWNRRRDFFIGRPASEVLGVRWANIRHDRQESFRFPGGKLWIAFLQIG